MAPVVEEWRADGLLFVDDDELDVAADDDGLAPMEGTGVDVDVEDEPPGPVECCELPFVANGL